MSFQCFFIRPTVINTGRAPFSEEVGQPLSVRRRGGGAGLPRRRGPGGEGVSALTLGSLEPGKGRSQQLPLWDGQPDHGPRRDTGVVKGGQGCLTSHRLAVTSQYWVQTGRMLGSGTCDLPQRAGTAQQPRTWGRAGTSGKGQSAVHGPQRDGLGGRMPRRH